MVLVPAALGFWWVQSSKLAALEAEKAQEQRAEALMEPVAGALESAEQTYDIDETIRVIHEIDRALAEHDSFDTYMTDLASRDYRYVAPEVLEARRRILEIQAELYGKQVLQGDQRAMWELTSELLLSTFSVVGVQGEADVLVSGSFEVDQAAAREILDDLKSERAASRALLEDVTALENELFTALMDYSEIYYRYVDEWDQLSILRDRSYLAVHNGDWDAARASAELAIERAPREREAHLLLAMAMIEQGNPEEDMAIVELLSDYIETHPGRSAPALLLLGVQHERRGRATEANLALQQSAAYYPKQADALTDMLDPYTVRAYLGRTREGERIVQLYTATMLGAGYFSPDLQLARAAFQNGDDEAGRTKVLDHFARRRAQKQWDFILSDLAFCHDLLGPHFWEIFPEDSYLDLQVAPTMWGSALTLAVDNRSERSLHNATLVLTLQLTDMLPGTYQAFPAEKTRPVVSAHEVTDFGTLNLETTVNGEAKTVEDIVHHRAILVSDEAVTWVDTDAFKLADLAKLREQQRTAEVEDAVIEHPLAERHPGFKKTAQRLFRDAEESGTMSVSSQYGKDDVLVELPRELAILKPIFRLRHGDTLYTAEDNVIEGDSIQLRFAGVDNFDAEAPEELELVVGTPFGEVVFSWEPGGDLRWTVE